PQRAKDRLGMCVGSDKSSCNDSDELLRRGLQEIDVHEAVRVSGPGALGVLARKLNAIFKPPADVLDQTAAYLKKQIGEYKVAQRAMQAVNYQAAAQAHIVGDHTSASNKLAAAAAAETETARGTSVGEKWTVASIDAKTLPREWMIPDEKRIAAHARNTPADVEPAPIAGVVFVKEATVSKRRN